MRLKRRNRFAAEVSTSSLNDIMFFLLLFFLIISTMANPSVIKLMLPKAQTSSAVSNQKITLTITKEKQIYLNSERVPMEMLETRLSEMINHQNEPLITLRLDKSLQIQDMVDVMQIGVKLKAKMVIATSKTSV